MWVITAVTLDANWIKTTDYENLWITIVSNYVIASMLSYNDIKYNLLILYPFLIATTVILA